VTHTGCKLNPNNECPFPEINKCKTKIFYTLKMAVFRDVASGTLVETD
jgi:hypothetical protein